MHNDWSPPSEWYFVTYSELFSAVVLVELEEDLVPQLPHSSLLGGPPFPSCYRERLSLSCWCSGCQEMTILRHLWGWQPRNQIDPYKRNSNNCKLCNIQDDAGCRVLIITYKT